MRKIIYLFIIIINTQLFIKAAINDTIIEKADNIIYMIINDSANLCFNRDAKSPVIKVKDSIINSLPCYPLRYYYTGKHIFMQEYDTIFYLDIISLKINKINNYKRNDILVGFHKHSPLIIGLDYSHKILYQILEYDVGKNEWNVVVSIDSFEMDINAFISKDIIMVKKCNLFDDEVENICLDYELINYSKNSSFKLNKKQLDISGNDWEDEIWLINNLNGSDLLYTFSISVNNIEKTTTHLLKENTLVKIPAFRPLNSKVEVFRGYYNDGILFALFFNNRTALIFLNSKDLFLQSLQSIKTNTIINAEVFEHTRSFDLNILKNMVYARHNLDFKNDYYEAYFNIFSFYYNGRDSRLPSVDHLLTPVDKENLRLIDEELERRAGGVHDP
jgi:hypothetical protein